MTGQRFTDLCYGFNAFWAAQLPLLDLPAADLGTTEMVPGDGFEIEAMLIGRFALSGAVITEIPSYEHNRYHGRTNLNAISDGFGCCGRDRKGARRGERDAAGIALDAGLPTICPALTKGPAVPRRQPHSARLRAAAARSASVRAPAMTTISRRPPRCAAPKLKPASTSYGRS